MEERNQRLCICFFRNGTFNSHLICHSVRSAENVNKLKDKEPQPVDTDNVAGIARRSMLCPKEVQRKPSFLFCAYIRTLWFSQVTNRNHFIASDCTYKVLELHINYRDCPSWFLSSFSLTWSNQVQIPSFKENWLLHGRWRRRKSNKFGSPQGFIFFFRLNLVSHKIPSKHNIRNFLKFRRARRHFLSTEYNWTKVRPGTLSSLGKKTCWMHSLMVSISGLETSFSFGNSGINFLYHLGGCLHFFHHWIA